MKKLFNLFNLFFLLILTNICLAQAPHKISFQAVIRNASNDLVTNSTVSMRISILQGSATGTAVYVETQSPVTNANGLASFYIGTGTVVSGIFDSVNWAVGPYYIKAETDPSGGSSYSVSSTQQLVSVPYSFYSEKSGVPGAIDLPVISTGPVSGITYTTATNIDTIKSNGGEFIFAKGVCIDTVPVPSINSAFVASGSLIGSYTVNLTGLAPGKLYHLRAFATNSNGTAYGDTVSFTTVALTPPTVTSDTMSGIGNNSASGGGTVTADGGNPVTARGICYSTTVNPTIANSTSPSGSGLGHFSTTLSGLTPSTTYYARAYATNAIGTAYGDQETFTTILYTVPTVTTDSSTNISYTSVTSGLNTSSDGNAAITAQGVCWSTSPSPTVAGSHIATANGIGHFTVNITGLTPNTIYYVRAYSTNAIGTAYGNQQTFTTLALSAPVLTTNAIIGISTVGATSGGNITIDGGSTVTSRGVCWSHNHATPTTADSITSDGTGAGMYNSNITGLNPGTTYYVRAYAINSTGTGYGAVVSFTTDSVLSTVTGVPVVGTISPSITTIVISGGYVSISGGSNVTAYGVCWGTSPSPTIPGSQTTDGSGLGYFSSVLGLTGCGTTYYIRAYATNSSGTGYGNQYAIVAGFLPVLVDSAIRNVTGTTAVCGGNVTSDGGCAVTQKGVCWGITAYPTITTGPTNWITTNGAGTGAFTANLTGLYNNYTYHLRTYATNASGTVYGTDQIFTTGTSSTLALGQTYAGGIIFYIDSSGNHGLVCAPSDQSGGPWGCQGTVVGDTATALGAGQSNTAAILANCTTPGIAAKICDSLVLGGYNDWFLPSIKELQFIYNNLYIMRLGGFIENYNYWSSSEYYYTGIQAGTQAWYEEFQTCVGCNATNNSGAYLKTSPYKVRAVRKF